MSEHRDIPEPGELVYPPRPSWAPAPSSPSALPALAVCGIFAEGFMVRGWIYSIIGVVILLAALRSMVRGAIRDYFRLPRKQHVRAAPSSPSRRSKPPQA